MKREWLIELRKSKKMFQREVASESNITMQLYSYIERGERNPSIEVAKKIALVLDFPWTRFFE